MNSLNCYGYNENGGLFRSTNSQKGLQYPPVKRVPVKRRECDAFFEENFGETTDLVAIMKKGGNGGNDGPKIEVSNNVVFYYWTSNRRHRSVVLDVSSGTVSLWPYGFGLTSVDDTYFYGIDLYDGCIKVYDVNGNLISETISIYPIDDPEVEWNTQMYVKLSFTEENQVPYVVKLQDKVWFTMTNEHLLGAQPYDDGDDEGADDNG